MNSDTKSNIEREVAAKARGTRQNIEREVAAKARGTRQKIIAAALEEFATRGKQGARIDRIAKNAGVNKAMIYYHFDSKDSLYLEVVTSFFRSVSKRAENTVLATDTLEDALTALTKLHADMFCALDTARTG